MTNNKLSYVQYDRPSQIDGLKTATENYTKYLKLYEETQNTIDKIESMGRTVSNELIEKLIGYEELYKDFKKTYDAGYNLFKELKKAQEIIDGNETKVTPELSENNEIKKLKNVINIQSCDYRRLNNNYVKLQADYSIQTREISSIKRKFDKFKDGIQKKLELIFKKEFIEELFEENNSK